MDQGILEAAIQEGLSIRQIQKRFGASNGSVRYWVKKYALKTSGKCDYTQWDSALIEKAIKGATSISDVLRNIGLTTRAGNFKTLQKYAKTFGIKLPIYDGKAGNKWGREITNEIAFVANSTVSRGVIKKRLLAEGRGNSCEICSQENEWHGKPLVMVLDHKNGINDDNRRENLRFICPNCNSTLDTHCSKNKVR